jgi:hypothetical protein
MKTRMQGPQGNQGPCALDTLHVTATALNPAS